MSTTKINDQKSNNRVALRVYEQVNLFYQKIAFTQLNETHPGFENILDSFARSETAGRLRDCESIISQSTCYNVLH
jgi:hypothetical protein